MMRLSVLLLLVLFSFDVIAFEPTTEDDHWDNWMKHYYQHKEPNKIPQLLKWIDQSDALKSNMSATFAIGGFLSEVFDQNPKMVETWLSNTNLKSDTYKEIMFAALMFSNKPNLAKQYLGINVSVSDREYISILRQQATNPTQLNLLLGRFYASGDRRYVIKVIKMLDIELDKNAELNSANSDVVFAMLARWSLGSNMQQHKLVTQIVKAEAAKSSGNLKTNLEDLLKENLIKQ